MATKSKIAAIPDALQREAPRSRFGFSRVEKDLGPAAHVWMLRSFRGDAIRLIAGSFAAILLAACSAEPPNRVYNRDPALPADLPFSSAVVVGDVIYLSGEIGRAPGSVTLVEGGVGAETRQIFENYKATLASHGADLSDIVKCTVFLENMSTYAEMNAAYAAAFPDEKPARSTLGVDGLAMGAALEIECLAVKK